MQLTKFSLITLFTILSFSAVNAQVDDNPTGDDVGAPGQPQVPVVQPPPIDDNGLPRPGDDRGTGTTSTSTTTRPTATATSVPTNAAMKTGMGALGVVSLFAYFLF